MDFLPCGSSAPAQPDRDLFIPNNLVGVGKFPAGFLWREVLPSCEGVCQHPLLGGDLGETSVFCEPVCAGETCLRMRGKQWHPR